MLGWENGVGPATEAITEGRDLGRCFAMNGTSGFLHVRLASRVHIHAISVEHADSLYSWDMSSAPRQVEAYGYEQEDSEPLLLGKLEYAIPSQSGDDVSAVQQVDVQRYRERTFSSVRIDVLSNHGNEDYTCLYRRQRMEWATLLLFLGVLGRDLPCPLSVFGPRESAYPFSEWSILPKKLLWIFSRIDASLLHHSSFDT
eukprot:scaffold388_cov244-Pinguiococcus_pyrenoidosus.AAC.4